MREHMKITLKGCPAPFLTPSIPRGDGNDWGDWVGRADIICLYGTGEREVIKAYDEFETLERLGRLGRLRY